MTATVVRRECAPPPHDCFTAAKWLLQAQTRLLPSREVSATSRETSPIGRDLGWSGGEMTAACREVSESPLRRHCEVPRRDLEAR